MMNKLLRREDGIAMLIVLALMAISVPIITAALGLSSVLSIDSSVKHEILSEQYCALGGDQHALYRLLYDSAYINGLAAGLPSSYTIVCDGKTIEVIIIKHANPPTWAYPDADDSRRLQTLKEVAPTTGMPNTPNTFTYTITVHNRDDEAESLTKIFDQLPPGFSYAAGSTSGVTTSDPAIAGQQLTWDLTALTLTLQPGESGTLIFDATANVGTEIYCNEAWADPGAKKTSSGKTAKVTIGFPLIQECPGYGAKVTKTLTASVNDDGTSYAPPDVVPSDTDITFTYRIDIENIGRSALSVTEVKDLLPPGFSYVDASISTIPPSVTPDPLISDVGGREELKWLFGLPRRITRGQSLSFIFEAEANVPPGDYWNEAWVTFPPSQIPEPVYTWPTARVMSMAVIETESDDDGNFACAQVWVGTDSYFIVEGDADEDDCP